MIRQIAINSHSSGKFTIEQFNGRDHIVTTMVSLESDSVMNNLFYAKEAVEASFMQLNALPAPASHPVVNGEHVSANHPLAVNAFNIGAMAMNPKLEGDKVLNDLVVDIAIAEKDSRGIELIKRIKNGECIGVSTGLDAEIIPNSGEAKGRKFDGMVSNIKFDHIAILLNEQPAGENTFTVNSEDEKTVIICNVEQSATQKPKAITPQTNHKGESMELNRENLVLSIVANSGNTLTESNHASLMGMSEMGLIAAVHNNAAPVEAAVVTVDEAVSVIELGGMFAINAEDSKLLEGLRTAETEKRDSVINSIVEKSEMTAEHLVNMDMGALESLAKSVNAPAADFSLQNAQSTAPASATGTITLHEDA